MPSHQVPGGLSLDRGLCCGQESSARRAIFIFINYEKNCHLWLAHKPYFSLTAGYALALPLVFNCHDFKNCIVYVDAFGAPFASGLDKDHPMQNITDAVNFIKNPEADDYNTIYIKAGGYSGETFPWIFDGATYKKISIFMAAGMLIIAATHQVRLQLYWDEGADLALAINSLSGVVNGLEIAGGGGFKAQLIVNNTGSTTYHV